LALVEGCKHSLEISIPVDLVESETSRVVDDIQKRAKLQGFRPGKAPANLIRKQFAGDIRQADFHPERRELFGRRQADAAGGAGDDGDAAFGDGGMMGHQGLFHGSGGMRRALWCAIE